jgi:endonuclease YncB( thermonuclease family)
MSDKSPHMTTYRSLALVTAGLLLILTAAGCNLRVQQGDGGSGNTDATLYEVVRIIDGDTIDVRQGEVTYRVRYIGINTPEDDETCYQEAANANRTLVEGQQVRLERDESNTDRFGRLLRYVYVGDLHVNEVLVREGWAEAVLYPPDDGFYTQFLALERAAANVNVGCHPTGIFNDGSYTR